MQEKKQSADLLRELQNLIAEELGQSPSQHTFEPLTDGLGLTSPRKADVSTPLPPITQDMRAPLFDDPAELTPPPPPTPRAPIPSRPIEKMFTVPLPRMEVKPPPQPIAPAPTPKIEPESAPQPEPRKLTLPLPSEAPPQKVARREPAPPGFARRFLAFVIDQVFVWTVWLFAVIVTLKALMGQVGQSPLTVPSTGSFQDPIFLRFALMEFATIWLAYLAIGVGVVDMTFGMWVWGLRLRYFGDDEVRFAKKALRVVMSFLFFAPIFPSLLLIFRRKGRNLLDLISGTGLCRDMV
ncbi:MAG: RDD family protein [Deltaproteobacteria bacterium]|nr:RDD family protein [Deltaproteobacteria bacterium]MBI3293331.1 RDD family protein [Deltaproteobacteria bacterium]